MKDYMYLNNNYYMKIVEENAEKQNITDAIDIKAISLSKVLKNKKYNNIYIMILRLSK